MKFTTLLSRFAPFGVVAFLLALLLDVHPLAVFGLAASSLVLLIAFADYAPRGRRAAMVYAPLRRSEAMPLAA
jgi:hypothetical protein